MTSIRRTTGLVFTLLMLLTITLGCEQKEKLIDIETPRGEVEVERNVDTGEVDVEVEREQSGGEL